MNHDLRNTVVPVSAGSPHGLSLLPETDAAVQLAAGTAGNQTQTVAEAARANRRASQGGGRTEAERRLEFIKNHLKRELDNEAEAQARLKHTERLVILKGHRAKMGLIGGLMVLLLLVGLIGVLYNENTAAAQSLLSTGAFDVDSIERARMVMLTPIAVGIAFILAFKLLPPFVRRRSFLAACGLLAAAFLTWAISFAIQTEKFRDDASQTIALVDGANSFDEPADLATGGEGGWSAWLMFGCLSLMMALTSFTGHLGVEAFLARYEQWVPNPEYARAHDDVQAHQCEIRADQAQYVAIEKSLGTMRDEEDREVAQALALYKRLKSEATGGAAGTIFAKSVAPILLMLLLLAGCAGGMNEKALRGKGVRGSLASDVLAGMPSKPSGAVIRVLALSPLLPPVDKAVARQQIEAELAWIANDAPVASSTVVVDALHCVPIARLDAVPGVSRIRKKALRKPAAAIREFLARHHPRAKDDGRIHLPRLAQTARQWRLPATTHVIVLGNPLFLNDASDKFFSMADGRVPSDGCLAEDPKLNIYSVVGRERGLEGQYWHLGWSNDGVFVDDTHRQAVLRFWHVYFQAQSARLVTAQPSFAAAAEAGRDGANEPLMLAESNPDASPAMVRIVKVESDETIDLEHKKADDVRAAQAAAASRAAKEAEAAHQAALENAVVEKETLVRELASLRNQLEQALREKEAPQVVQRDFEVARDEHGNLLGSENDLIADGRMGGHKIVLATLWRDKEVDDSPLAAALETKGFTVERLTSPLPSLTAFEHALDGAKQLWLWSSPEAGKLPKGHLQTIVKRWRQGKLALCLLSDNTPYTFEAAAVLSAISPGSTIRGDYRGEQTLHPRLGRGGGFDPQSPLFHHIDALYEGATVSAISGPGLVPVCHASNGAPLVVTLEQNGSSRLVAHGGFTSFFRRFWDDAGISRFAANCAGWLSGAERDIKK